MKIKRLAAAGYGRLQDWSSPELDSGLVVFYGTNEAGKSTLLSLIGTLFYGFSPANGTAHPYVPWGSNEAVCSAELVLHDGSSISVYRSLKSRPSGQLLSGSSSTSIGNQPLPVLGSLPRQVFFEVYALTLDQLRFPQAEVWEVVQDQLLGGQFSSFLKPVSEVLSELEGEVNSLWRPDRRGKPAAKQLQTELRRLKALRRETLEKEENLRRAQERLAELRARLQQLLEEKTQITVKLQRAERLLPVYQVIVRIRQLERQAGSLAAYRDIPEHPLEYLAQLEQQAAAVREEIEARQSELNKLLEQQARFDCTDKAVIMHRQQIQALTRAYHMIEEDQRALQDTEQKLTILRERLADRARLVLRGGWQPYYTDAVLNIDEAELRASLQVLKGVENDLRQLEARCAGVKSLHAASNTSRRQLWLAGALTALGAISYLITRDSGSLSLLAVALVASGVGMLLSGLLGRSSTDKGDLQILENELTELKRQRLEVLDAVKNRLQGLPVASQRLDNPDDTLLVDICALKELVQDMHMTQDYRAAVANRLEKKRSECTAIMKQCGLKCSSDLLQDISQLESALERAQLHQQAAQKASEVLTSVSSQLSRLQATHEDLTKQLELLRFRLSQLDGESLTEKAARLAERRRCAQLAGEFIQELQRQYPNYPELKRELAVLEAEQRLAEISEETIARLKVQLEQTENEINSTNADMSALETEIRLEMEQQRLADLEGEIESLEHQLAEVKRRRDQLALLQKLVMTAEREFREEHQPDVLKRAGRYLSLITAGRYFRLYLDKDGYYLSASREDRDDPLAVKPHTLSRGTLEQIYLALRLALLEHLDPAGESLPLLLDEALVNWDGARLEQGLKLLQQVARERQILMFTCHRWLVEQLQTQAQVVEVL